MIIVITGPSGVGKTDTSWALLEQFGNMVFLDCDWFASKVPFSWANEADVKSVFQALSLMIAFHLSRGEKFFVIPITVQMAELYQKYAHYFLKWQLPVKKFRLRCTDQALAKRINERERIDWQKQAELAEMANSQSCFDRLFPDNSLFHLIDTTGLTENEVAKQICILTNDE